MIPTMIEAESRQNILTCNNDVSHVREIYVNKLYLTLHPIKRYLGRIHVSRNMFALWGGGRVRIVPQYPLLVVQEDYMGGFLTRQKQPGSRYRESDS